MFSWLKKCPLFLGTDMGFDCFRIHSKCQAMCCKCAPIEKEIYERNRDKLVRPVLEEHEFEGYDKLEKTNKMLLLPVTKDGYCPFLHSDFRCGIEQDKPSICKKYGSEEDPNLRCPFQNRDGVLRSRQENRKILREADKEQVKMISEFNRFNIIQG